MIKVLESDIHGKDCWINVPDSFLKKLGWEPGDKLELFISSIYEGQLIIDKAKKNGK